MTSNEMCDIQRRMGTCYEGKLIAHAHVDMTTLCIEISKLQEEASRLENCLREVAEWFRTRERDDIRVGAGAPGQLRKIMEVIEG